MNLHLVLSLLVVLGYYVVFRNCDKLGKSSSLFRLILLMVAEDTMTALTYFMNARMPHLSTEPPTTESLARAEQAQALILGTGLVVSVIGACCLVGVILRFTKPPSPKTQSKQGSSSSPSSNM